MAAAGMIKDPILAPAETTGIVDWLIATDRAPNFRPADA